MTETKAFIKNIWRGGFFFIGPCERPIEGKLNPKSLQVRLVCSVHISIAGCAIFVSYEPYRKSSMKPPQFHFGHSDFISDTLEGDLIG